MTMKRISTERPAKRKKNILPVNRTHYFLSRGIKPQQFTYRGVRLNIDISSPFY